MNKLSLGFAALALVLKFAPGAHAQEAPFKRPDCSAYASKPEPEASCFRDRKLEIRDANFAALQKTGLEFEYLARPDPESNLQAKKAAEDKTEGEFLVEFSVATDGTVQDVRIVAASSEPIRHLAKLWADTIAQWKFAKIDKPVADVPFRRIYLYSTQDDDRRTRKSGT